MSVLNSEVYAVQYSYLNGGYTTSYPFNDTKFPQYYQSYLNNQPIDKSIWLFQLPDSPYAPFRYFTTRVRDSRTGSVYKPVEKRERNRLNKVFWRPALSIYPGNRDLRGYQYLNRCFWSPSAINPQCDARFILRFNYGNTCLCPQFSLVNILTGATISNVYYDNMIDNYNNGEWLVYSINLLAITGVDGASGDRTQGISDFTVFAQFSGEVYESQAGSNVIQAEKQGTGYWCNGGNLVNFGHWWERQTLDGDNVTFYELDSMYVPFDTDGDIVVTAERTEGSYKYIYKGFTPTDAGHVVTSLGMYWATNFDSYKKAALGTHCTDPNIKCALIGDGNKVIFNDPDGDTYTGEDIQAVALSDPDSSFNWGGGAEDYDGLTTEEIQEETNPDNSEDTDETGLNDLTYSTAGTFNTTYICRQDQLDGVAQWLWNGSPDLEWSSVIAGLSLMGETPINAVVSIKLYPFNLAQVATSGAYQTIYVGKESTGIQARAVSQSTFILDLGSMHYDVGDKLAFLNFEPYATAHLYIPFCGVISLSPTEIIDKDISVKMIVDIVTGACTGVLFLDGIAYAYKDGSIGVDVPITGTNMSQYLSSVIGTTMAGGTAGAAVGGVLAGAIANPAGAVAVQAVGGVIGAMAGGLAARTRGMSIVKQGASTPACALAEPLYCYLIFETPRQIEWLTNYGHTQGYLSYRTGTVVSLIGTGYSMFSNVDTSGVSGATDEERIEIKDLMERGVFL